MRGYFCHFLLFANLTEIYHLKILEDSPVFLNLSAILNVQLKFYNTISKSFALNNNTKMSNLQSNRQNIAIAQSICQIRGTSACTNKKIFVGGIPHNISEEKLYKYFSKFGEVTRVDLPRNAKTGALRGFSFVHFSKSESVDRVFQVKVHKLRGKKMAIRRAMESNKAHNVTKDLQNKKLYVSNFPKSNQITEEMVQECFQRFGPVDRVLMAFDSQQKKFRGFCYVIMKN